VNIRTNFQYHHWIAVDDDTYDGPGSLIGIGRTEQEAIDDFLEQILEKESKS